MNKTSTKQAFTVRESLRVPFRDRDLMYVDSFITYCKEYGVETDRKELEYLEQENLLLPAARIHPGYVDMRKISLTKKKPGQDRVWTAVPAYSLKGKYFLRSEVEKVKCQAIDTTKYKTLGSFVSRLRTDGWVHQFQSLVRDVVNEPFLPWDSYHKSTEFLFTEDNLYPMAYDTFYVPFQVYLLAIIQKNLKPTAGIESSDWQVQEWTQVGRNRKVASKHFDRKKFVRDRLLEYLHFYRIYLAIRDVWDEANKELAAEYTQGERDQHDKIKNRLLMKREWKKLDEKEQLKIVAHLHGSEPLIAKAAEREKERHYKELREEKLPAQIELILEKHNVTLAYLHQWRLNLREIGTFSNRFRWANTLYLRRIPEEILYLAEEPYKMIYHLNWALSLFDWQQLTIQEVLLGDVDERCPYCGIRPKMQKENSKTCGDSECKKKHKIVLDQHRDRRKKA